MIQKSIPQFEEYLSGLLQKSYPSQNPFPKVDLQTPAEAVNGDLSTAVSMRCAKILQKPPIAIAQEFIKVFEQNIPSSPWAKHILKIEFKAPGFINFFFTPQVLFDIVAQVYKEGENYGKSNIGNGKKVQIESVSANPTGPLSIAHARQAAVGDALSNILNFLGFDA